jgi:hypothetical protein
MAKEPKQLAELFDNTHKDIDDPVCDIALPRINCPFGVYIGMSACGT